MRRLGVLMSRKEIVPERLPGRVAVVIDVFMATTTLLTILENGARRVFPVGSLQEGEEVYARVGPEALRGGEQGAERVEGYDFGPLPEEYPPEKVAGRDVVFLTTNGTRAISEVAAADVVLVSCLRNAPATARYLESSGAEAVYLVCAGSGGRFDLEDFLGASAIVSRLDVEEWSLNDAAILARDWAGRLEDPVAVLARSRAGRWFVEHDRIETLRFAADVGASEAVLEVRDGTLRRVEETGGGSRAAEDEQGV